MGSKNVILNKDSETIDLANARGNYKAVRLVAKRRGIELNNVEVVYSNGASHNEKRTINLLDGERTRAIDERGDGKFIDKINLSFKAQPTAVIPAVIEVYGLQTEAGARASRRMGAAVLRPGARPWQAPKGEGGARPSRRMEIAALAMAPAGAQARGGRASNCPDGGCCPVS